MTKAKAGWFKYRGFLLYKDSEGEWRWQIKDQGNSEILNASTQGYKNRGDCVDNLRQTAIGAVQFLGMLAAKERS